MTTAPSGDCGAHPERRNSHFSQHGQASSAADLACVDIMQSTGDSSVVEAGSPGALMLAAMPADVSEDVELLARRFGSAGRSLYAVGGTVRNHLLEEQIGADGDLDFASDATPDETKSLLAKDAESLWPQGEKYGTIAAIINGRSYEITTLRAESYQPDRRQPDVHWVTEIGADLERRDFTVNAVAVRFPGGELVDPFDGAADLAAGVLRTPLEPQITFSEDPLRMIRAARFMAQLQMRPDTATEAAVHEMADRIEIVASERIMPEIDKLLACDAPSDGLRLLWHSGILEQVLKGPLGDAETVIGRVAAGHGVDERTALLLSDVENLSVERLMRCRWPSSRARHAIASLSAARSAVGHPPVSDAELRRWEHSAGEAADTAAAAAEAMGAAGLRTRRASLAARGQRTGRLPLDGGQIMTLLSIPAGPDIGRAKQALTEAMIIHGPMGRKNAEGWLRQWASQQRLNAG